MPISECWAVNKFRKTLRVALCLGLFGWALPAAASCSVSATNLAFGDYDSLGGLPVDSVGSVTVSCILSLGYNIELSQGGAGSFDPRTLISGANTLDYNLFTDATYLTIWGDGSASTAVVSGSVGLLLLPVVHTVYGRIPGGQNVAAGSYADTITVTVVF